MWSMSTIVKYSSSAPQAHRSPCSRSGHGGNGSSPNTVTTRCRRWCPSQRSDAAWVANRSTRRAIADNRLSIATSCSTATGASEIPFLPPRPERVHFGLDLISRLCRPVCRPLLPNYLYPRDEVCRSKAPTPPLHVGRQPLDARSHAPESSAHRYYLPGCRRRWCSSISSSFRMMVSASCWWMPSSATVRAAPKRTFG